MAKYLRDQQISNITINSEALSRIVDSLFQRLVLMPEYLQNPEQPDAILSMTIRFDEKGYKVYSKEELLKYFNEAKDVERIIFELVSGEAIRTNKGNGSYLDLRLDKHDLVTCFLTSCSDDENWMNCSLNTLKDTFDNYSNKFSWARSRWVELITQMAGVFFGFILSLWGASKIAPNLEIENAFLISFLLVLLIFSNLWSYLNLILKSFIYKTFPKVKFHRPGKNKLQWLTQGLVIGFSVAAGLFLINLGFNYIGRMLGVFLGSGA